MRLLDIYDERDLDDETETLSLEVGEDELAFDFTVGMIEANALEAVKTYIGDMTVKEAFEEFAEGDQQEFVRRLTEGFDEDRVVILRGETMVDGNHHLMAAILIGKPVRFIDLDDATAPAPLPC